MVANALASSPHTALNPEQVTIEDLFAAAQGRQGQPRRGRQAQMSTVARRTFRSTPAARCAPDLDRDRGPADAGQDPAPHGSSCSPSPASPPASSPTRRPRTRRSSSPATARARGSIASTTTTRSTAPDANEDALGFDPLKGDWRVSLPCPPTISAGCRAR